MTFIGISQHINFKTFLGKFLKFKELTNEEIKDLHFYFWRTSTSKLANLTYKIQLEFYEKKYPKGYDYSTFLPEKDPFQADGYGDLNCSNEDDRSGKINLVGSPSA